jgi:hypothetical protein
MTIDPTVLQALHDHPHCKGAQVAVDDAQRRHAEAEQRAQAAQDELAAAEHEAATGQRDDKRLQRAHDALTRAQSDLRIAQKRVTATLLAQSTTQQNASVEIDRILTERHKDAVRQLDEALAVARDCSHEVARLESASRRLFHGGPYRLYDKLYGRPLRELSWFKEFGVSMHSKASETRYGYWHEHIQRYLKKGA